MSILDSYLSTTRERPSGSSRWDSEREVLIKEHLNETSADMQYWLEVGTNDRAGSSHPIETPTQPIEQLYLSLASEADVIVKIEEICPGRDVLTMATDLPVQGLKPFSLLHRGRSPAVMVG